jgi:hypothetical protein
VSSGRTVAACWACILVSWFAIFLLHDYALSFVALLAGFWLNGYWFAKRKRRLNTKVGSITFVDCTFEDIS